MSSSAHPTRAFVIIDVQNDYFANGVCPIEGAEDILPVINKLRRKDFDFTILVQLWHPINHCSFSSNNPGYPPMKVSHIPDLGPQMLWPDYCVAGTFGAEFHSELLMRHSDIIIQCGNNPNIDNYSAFREVRKDNSSCMINEIITQNNIKEIYFCGLAVEYGIQFNILDCNIFATGCQIFCITDACRGFNEEKMKEILTKLEYEKVHTVNSNGPELQLIADIETRVLITNNIINIVSCRGSATYELSSHPLEVGDKLWLDMKNKCTKMNSMIEGCYYIKGNNSDHTNTASDFLILSSKSKCLLYILWPASNKKTTWLSKNFEFMNQYVNTDSSNIVLEIWKMKECIGAGERMYLGGAEGNLVDKQHYNYIVCIKSQPPDVNDVIHAIYYETDETLRTIMSSCGELDNHLPPLSRTPFHAAVVANRMLAIDILIECGIDINSVDINGDTPLILACRLNRMEIIEKLIIEKTLRVNALSKLDRGSALLIACQMGNTKAVQLIADHGALISATNRYNATSLTFAFYHHEDIAYRIINILFAHTKSNEEKSFLLQEPDKFGWNAMIVAARVGCLHKINFSKFPGLIDLVTVNCYTKRGFSLLHYTSWNCNLDDINMLIENSHYWKEELELNTISEENGYSELDLTILKDNNECSRTLVLGGSHSTICTGQPIHRLLYYMITMGENNVVEGLLRFDDNKFNIDESLIKYTKRTKYIGSCTFSFANFTNPITQHMYRCVTCDTLICNICRLKCHNGHDILYKGLVNDTYCFCQKSTCQALLGVDKRETEGYKYVPNPVDTSSIPDNPNLDKLIQCLAINSHEVWSQEHIEDGWRYGQQRDNKRRIHPLLLPWNLLTDGDKKWDIESAKHNIRLIEYLGYEIICESEDYANAFLDDCSMNYEGGKYNPSPLDTAEVQLTDQMLVLVQLLAKNSHEEWAKSKIDNGWKYAPEGKDSEKLSPLLVPYELLSDEEKLSSQLNGIETIKGICMLGYNIVYNGDEDKQMNMTSLFKGDEYASLKENMARMEEVRLDFFNLYLLRACRNDQVDIIPNLVQSEQQVIANINIQDSYGQTPLYVAVKRGNYATVELLLKLHANIFLNDNNGMTPLMIAAFLGNYKICELLLQNHAKIFARDINGFTAIHHACANGHSKVLELLLSEKYVDINFLCTIKEEDKTSWKGKFKKKQAVSPSSSSKVLPLDNEDESTKLMSKSVKNQETVAETPLESTLPTVTPTNNDKNKDNKDNNTVNDNANSIPPSSSILQSNSNFQSTISSNQPISNNKLSIRIKKSLDNGRPTTPSKLNILKKSNFPQLLVQNQNQSNNNSADNNSNNNQNLAAIPELSFPEGDKGKRKISSKKSILNKLAALDGFKSVGGGGDGKSMRTARLKRRSSILSSPSSPQSTSRILKSPTAELMTSRRRENRSNLFLTSAPVINTPLCLYNPLNLAVKASRRDVIKVLLDHEANPNIKDGTGISPYNRALMKRAAAAIYEKDKNEKEEREFREMLGDKSKLTRAIKFLRKYCCCCFKKCVDETNELEKEEKSMRESSKSIILDEEASLKAPNPQHKQDSKMKIRDKWISTLSKPIKERKDDRQIADMELASKVVDELATSENVQQRRSTFGLWQFFKEGIIFLILYILLLSFTSAFFDYGTQNELSFVQITDQDLKESGFSDIFSFDDYNNWVVTYLFNPSGNGLIQPPLYPNTAAVYHENNYVFGAARLSTIEYKKVVCKSTEYLDLSTLQYPCYKDNDDASPPVDIPLTDLSAARNKYEQLLNDGLITHDTKSISFFINIFNPSTSRLCILEMTITKLPTGEYESRHEAKTTRFGDDRFSPSRSFEVIIGLEIAVELYFKVKYIIQSKGIGEQFSDNWLIYEWLLLIGLFILLILDLIVYSQVSNDSIEFTSNTYTDFSKSMDLIKGELDLTSIISFLFGLRFIKYLRLIPVWGPMVLAVIQSISARDVLLYIFVFFLMMIILCFSYDVSFGVEVEVFAQLITSFFELFCSSFNQEYSRTYNLDKRPLFTIYFVIYVLLSLILVNLFVGIISDIYPKVREESETTWKILMAEYMTDNVVSDQKLEGGNTIRRPSIIFELLEEDHWGNLMEGRDGIIYWTPNGLYSPEKEKKKRRKIENKDSKDENNGPELNETADMILKEVNRLKANFTLQNETIEGLNDKISKIFELLQEVNENSKKSNVIGGNQTLLLKRKKTRVKIVDTD